jgi:uncharacterized repeat protein (TIGR02543 family)
VSTLPAAPTKTGYTFGGWYTATSGGGAAFTATTPVAADITVYAKWTAIPGAFTQDDLTGTWRLNMLISGRDNGWVRAMVSINSSGVATCVSTSDSGGATSCPGTFDLTLTISASGVISQSGYNAANAGTDHMTMTSNKNFAAGTSTNGDSPNYKYQLSIMQKVVTGTSYSNADVQSKSFVYHQLRVGSDNEWEYGTGTTGVAGAITVTSATRPSGTDTPGAVGTMSLDSNGVVTMSGTDMAIFQGFLSDDKKTIVGTQTSSGTGHTNYGLMIIQVTGQTYTAGLLPAGISAAHMLAVGSTPAPFWLHFTSTVASGGVMSFSDWESSNSGVTAPGTTYTGHISSSGTLTIDEISSYHGQVSDDGKFTVATQTVATGAYSLQVSTK